MGSLTPIVEKEGPVNNASIIRDFGGKVVF